MLWQYNAYQPLPRNVANAYFPDYFFVNELRNYFDKPKIVQKFLRTAF